MLSKCVYEDKAVIHELTQGLQMAQQLRDNLHSPKTRDFYIQMILFSYDKALCILRSGHSAGQLPHRPESSISFASPRSEQFQFDQPFPGQQSENTLSRKRKESTWEEEHSKVHKCFATKQVHEKTEDPTLFDIAYNQGAQSASPPPLSPEIYAITPTRHQLSPPSPGEMLSNLRANLITVNTSDLGVDSDTIPSSFSFPSTSSGLMDDNLQLHFPNYSDDEFLPIFSPPFISPVTSESNMFTEWGSSQSLDFLADADVDFEFNNSLF